MNKDVSEILFSEQDIAERVRVMGENITADYADIAGEEGIVVISVLRGGAMFSCDLIRCIDLPLELDFMAVSSYGNGVKSSGVVRILKDLNTDIQGRHVIIAEDIIDSGLTLRYLMDNLLSRNPASLTVAALLKKNVEGQADINCRYVAFECPNEFIVGYGLDYAEHYRNLPYIGILKPEVYE